MSGTTFSKLPVMIVALVIGLILTFTAVMPLVSDYSEAKTFDNKEGSLFSVEKITEDSPYQFVWDITNRTSATINGKEFNLSPSTLICTSGDYLLRYSYNSGNGNASIQSIGGSLGLLLSTSSATTGSLTIDNTTNTGYLTFTLVKDGGDPVVKTYAIGDTYGMSDKGDYVMKSPNQTAYLKSDSEILAMGLTTFNGDYATGFYISGNPTDGFTAVNFFPVPATANTSNLTSDLTEIDNYVDLYTLKEIKFTISGVSDPTITTNATYSYFIVPSEVTADPDNPAAYKNLVSVLPLFALILLVAGAASLVYFKNKD